MKPLIVVLFCAATALAQTPIDKAFTIPDFKVTAESLAKALPKKRSMFVYPPALRTSPVLTGVLEPVCLAMRSYNFDNSATPKLVSETNCTMAKPNGFLRVRR